MNHVDDGDGQCATCYAHLRYAEPECSGCTCDHDCRFDRERHDHTCEHYDDCEWWGKHPYLQKQVIIDIYNPQYGDKRKCSCGHMYKFHFAGDSDKSRDVCSWCGCGKFEEITK